MANILGGSGVLTGPSAAESAIAAAAGIRAGTASHSQAAQGVVTAMASSTQLGQQRKRDAEAKRAALWKETMDLATAIAKDAQIPINQVFDDPYTRQFLMSKLGTSQNIASASDQEKQGFFQTLFNKEAGDLKTRAKAAFGGLFGGNQNTQGPDFAALGQSYAGPEGERSRILRIMQQNGYDFASLTPADQSAYLAMKASAPGPAPAPAQRPTAAPGPAPVSPEPAEPVVEQPPAGGPAMINPSGALPIPANRTPSVGSFTASGPHGETMGEMAAAGPDYWNSYLDKAAPVDAPQTAAPASASREQRIQMEFDRLRKEWGNQRTLSVRNIQEMKQKAADIVDGKNVADAPDPSIPYPAGNTGVSAQGTQPAGTPSEGELLAFNQWLKDNPDKAKLAAPVTRIYETKAQRDRFLVPLIGNNAWNTWKAEQGSAGTTATSPASSPADAVAGSPASAMGIPAVPASAPSAVPPPPARAPTTPAPPAQAQAQAAAAPPEVQKLSLAHANTLGWGQEQQQLVTRFYNNDPTLTDREKADAARLDKQAQDILTTQARQTGITLRPGINSPKSVALAQQWLKMTDPESALLTDPRLSHLGENVSQLSIEALKAETRSKLADIDLKGSEAALNRAKIANLDKELETQKVIASAAWLEQQNEVFKLVADAARGRMDAYIAQWQPLFEAAKNSKEVEELTDRYLVAITKDSVLQGYNLAMSQALSAGTGLKVDLFEVNAASKGIFPWTKQAAGAALGYTVVPPGGVTAGTTAQSFDETAAEADTFYPVK